MGDNEETSTGPTEQESVHALQEPEAPPSAEEVEQRGSAPPDPSAETPAPRPDSEEEHEEGNDEETNASEDGGDDQQEEVAGVSSSEVKNIILQVLSPYFEDDGTEGGEEEDTAQRYDHLKCKNWIQLICDGILERLLALGKPFKYIAHCMIMRKCGAGMHVCSSCYFGPADGWVSHAHDLSAHIYAVVTVYWLPI